MNRLITYPGAIPLDTDLLYTNKYAMIGLGWLAQACLGTSTVVDGFTCIQQAAPNLTVQLTAGAIYTYTSTDASAYGSLALDTTHSLVKQGLLLDTVNLACAAPGTSGRTRLAPVATTTEVAPVARMAAAVAGVERRTSTPASAMAADR